MFSLFLFSINASIQDIQINWQYFTETCQETLQPSDPSFKKNLALRCLRGDAGMHPKAIELLTELSEQHDSESQILLGVCCVHGIGMISNPSLAFSWMQQAALKNHREACKNLGIMYAEGIGTSRNYEQAVLYLERAIKNGHHAAERILGMHFFYGMIIKKDEKKAVELMQTAADGGDVEALYNLGIFYEKGFGQLLLPNIQKAFEFYYKAAEKKYLPAEEALSQFFEKNKSLADTGNIAAQCVVGCMYYHGFGTAKDLEQAFFYTTAAANAGNREALYNLGIHYQYGHGVSKDLEAAFARYSAAAHERFNLANAQRIVGEMLLQGMDVSQDKTKAAFEWIKKAAKQGDSIALTNLGIMYFYGIGTKADEELGREYLKAAIENGRSESEAILKTLVRSKLSDTTVLETRSMMTGFTEAISGALQFTSSALKYVVPRKTSRDDEDMVPLRTGEFTDIQIIDTSPLREGLRHRKIPASAIPRTEPRVVRTFVDTQEEGAEQEVAAVASSGHDSLQSVLARLKKLGFVFEDQDPKMEFQSAIDELKNKTKIEKLNYDDKYTVIKILTKITQKWGNGRKVADAIGIDPRRLSDLKMQKLGETNIHFQKAKEWLKTTPVEEIVRLTGVTEKKLASIF